MDYDVPIIKKRFAAFVKSRRISQSTLAFHAKISQQAVNKWFEEKNETMPNLYVIHWLMAQYNLGLNWLMTGDVNSGILSKEIPADENYWNNQIVNNSQIGEVNNNQHNTNCSDCRVVERLTETNRELSETNKKLTDKLLEKL